ncbi:unnamed protein product [Closterium sp. NIES-54]
MPQQANMLPSAVKAHCAHLHSSASVASSSLSFLALNLNSASTVISPPSPTLFPFRCLSTSPLLSCPFPCPSSLSFRSSSSSRSASPSSSLASSLSCCRSRTSLIHQSQASVQCSRGIRHLSLGHPNSLPHCCQLYCQLPSPPCSPLSSLVSDCTAHKAAPQFPCSLLSPLCTGWEGWEGKGEAAGVVAARVEDVGNGEEGRAEEEEEDENGEGEGEDEDEEEEVDEGALARVTGKDCVRENQEPGGRIWEEFDFCVDSEATWEAVNSVSRPLARWDGGVTRTSDRRARESRENPRAEPGNQGGWRRGGRVRRG